MSIISFAWSGYVGGDVHASASSMFERAAVVLVLLVNLLSRLISAAADLWEEK